MSGVTNEVAAPIYLKVKGLDGKRFFFKMKRNTHLKTLMNTYCHHLSVDFDYFAFLFNGRQLQGDQTPDELEMVHDDEIDALPHIIRGGAVF